MATPYQMNFASARRQGQARAAAPAPAPASNTPSFALPPMGTSTPLPPPSRPTPVQQGVDPLSVLAAQQQKFNQRGMPAPSRANLLPAQQPGFMQRMYGGMRGNPGSVPLPPMYAGPKPPGAPVQRMPVYGGSQPPRGPGMPPPQMAPLPGYGGGYRAAPGMGGGYPNVAASVMGNPNLTAWQQQAAAQDAWRRRMMGGMVGRENREDFATPAVMPQRPGNPGIAGVVSRLGGQGGYPVAAPPRSSIGGQPDTRALAPARYF
jgi:hypothetical protein